MTAGVKANVDGSAAIQVGGTDVLGLSSTGNLNFPISGQRITGDFSNATDANRVMFQTNTTNAATVVGVIPNGTIQNSQLRVYYDSNVTNSSWGAMTVFGGSINFISGITGTGTYLPMTFYTGGSERLRIDTSGTLTYAVSTLASYQWTQWNPTNLTGTITTAPATGTADDSNYVTMSNASGTLTVTFDVAGTYLICINCLTQHAAIYTYDTIYANLGGTATRRIGRDDPNNWGDGSNDGNLAITTSFYVSATATQTLTIQPQFRTVGSGTTGQHTAYCNATIQYCGG
jgi:hypothetical protein